MNNDTQKLNNILTQIRTGIYNGSLDNLTPMLPFMFKLRGNPYTLKDYFLWEPLFKLEIPINRTIKSARQIGKTISLDHGIIVMANGELRKAADVAVGDRVLVLDEHNAWKSSTAKVSHIFKDYTKSFFSVETSSGCTLIVSSEHKLRTPQGYVPLGSLHTGSRICRITKGGVFPDNTVDHRRLAFTACFISKGRGSDGVYLSSDHRGALRELRDLFPDARLDNNAGGRTRTLRFNKTDSSSVVYDWLKEDGLYGCAACRRFIPNWVFDLSRKDTLAFLSRLWATGGGVKLRNGNRVSITYCNNSRTLVDGIQSLLTKLGIPTSIRTKMTYFNQGQTLWELCVKAGAGYDIFLSEVSTFDDPDTRRPTTTVPNNHETWPLPYINEKVKAWAKSTPKGCKERLSARGLRKTLKTAPTISTLKKYADYFTDIGHVLASSELSDIIDSDVEWDTIKSVTHLGELDAIDFEVEEHHNFVMSGGIVTHNSENSAVQMLTYTAIMDYLNILYVAPRQEQTRVFSNEKIGPFIQGSPLFAGRDPKLPMNTHHRVPREGNHLYFSYALLDAERIRSKTAGALFMDEAQDLDSSFIPVLTETMSASRLGLQQSTGTPKTFDNNLEFQWEQSSQAEWCIPCHNCMKLNVSGAEYDLLDMVHPQGLSCAKCSKLIDTRQGWWEHRYPERRAAHEGYHAPQPVFPIHCEHFDDEDKSKPPRKWQDLIRSQVEYATYRFFNEKLGESYDNADELISKKALLAFSTLDHDNELKQAIKASRSKIYHTITVGADWGGGGESGLSRTAVVVLGWKADTKPDVLYMTRLTNPLPPDEEAMHVWKIFRQFRAHLLADDFCGAGEVKEVILLQMGFPHNQLMPVAYSPSTTKKVLEYVPVDENNQKPYIKASKVKSLSIMAALINKGYYKFPRFNSWDSYHYPDNLLALVQEKRDKPTSGATFLITRKKSRADDLAHALNYASIAYWFTTGNTPDFTSLISNIPGLTNTSPSDEELGVDAGF